MFYKLKDATHIQYRLLWNFALKYALKNAGFFFFFNLQLCSFDLNTSKELHINGQYEPNYSLDTKQICVSSPSRPPLMPSLPFTPGKQNRRKTVCWRCERAGSLQGRGDIAALSDTPLFRDILLFAFEYFAFCSWGKSWDFHPA